MTPGNVAAFFDLDRTLIDVNSAVLYALFERRHGRVSTWQVLTTIFHTTLYHLNIGSVERSYANAIRHFRGTLESDLAAWAREFFEEQVKSRLQPGAIPVLEEHRRSGHRLVMLTSSSAYQARCAAEAWGFDHWIANRFPTENGRLIGTYERPLVYAAGKVFHAKAWADAQGINLRSSYFYSDSYSDLPMLEAVGHPLVVNPDAKLKAHARKNQWKILDWRAAR